MLAAAVGALGCALDTRPRHPVAIISAAIMLLAMLDMALGHVLLVPVAWTAVLLALGVFVVTLPTAAHDLCGWHHGLALVAAAMIMVSGPHALPEASATGFDHLGHLDSTIQPGGGWMIGLLITVGYVLVAATPLLRSEAAENGATVPAGRTGMPERSGRTRISARAIRVAHVASTASCLALMSLLPVLT